MFSKILFYPGPSASVFLVTGCRGPHPYVAISASCFVSILVYSDSSLIRSKPIVHTVCMTIFVNGQCSMMHSFTVALLFDVYTGTTFSTIHLKSVELLLLHYFRRNVVFLWQIEQSFMLLHNSLRHLILSRVFALVNGTAHIICVFTVLESELWMNLVKSAFMMWTIFIKMALPHLHS